MKSEESYTMAELADVYELSLSIGTSLELEKNCQTFFRSLVQRKNLNYIGIWHKTDECLMLQSSYPKKSVLKEAKILTETKLYKDLLSKPSGEIFNIKVSNYKELERFDSKPTYGYFEDELFVFLVQNPASDPFGKREMSQLNTLFSKFIESVKASISHKLLLKEIIRRQGVEDRLFERESYFRFGANSLSEGIIVTDLEDRITYVNRAMKDITGFTRTEMLDSIANELFKPVGIKDFVKDIILSKRTKDVSEVYERQQVHKEGYIYWVRITASAFKNPDNEIVGTIGTMLNINEQRNSEQKLRLVIDTALDAVITMNQKGEITEWNKNAERIFGYTYEEVIGNELSGYIIPEEYREAHKAGMKRYFKTGEGSLLNQRIEITAIDKTKRMFPIELAITPVIQNDNTFFSAFVRDISERKEIEQQKEGLLKELEVVNQELKDFAYNVSHDLKAPLRSIGSLSDWLIQDYEGVLDDAGKDLLTLLKNRIRRMHSLIEDVLNYSKIGRLKVDKSTVKVTELLEETLELIGVPEACQITVSPNMPDVVYDRTRLQQVFQNLISNAIKFLDKPNGLIEVSFSEDDSYYTFSITDNGAGIEERYFDKIFQIFQTLVSKDKFESTGIGLSIVKRIVELNGGTIGVESQVGIGSTFYFTIPKVKK